MFLIRGFKAAAHEDAVTCGDVAVRCVRSKKAVKSRKVLDEVSWLTARGELSETRPLSVCLDSSS